MALDRKLTGTVSRIKVFTGPVQRNKRKMENPRRDMVSVTVEEIRARKEVGLAHPDRMKRIKRR